jgi:thymidylate synthase (FAD)
MKQAYLHRQIEKDYEWALKNGVAKEQARAILPEGNTVSTLYMAGSLRSWLHYCELRMANGTQAEHMEIASMCWDIIKTHFPALVDAIDLDSQS